MEDETFFCYSGDKLNKNGKCHNILGYNSNYGLLIRNSIENYYGNEEHIQGLQVVDHFCHFSIWYAREFWNSGLSKRIIATKD